MISKVRLNAWPTGGRRINVQGGRVPFCTVNLGTLIWVVLRPPPQYNLWNGVPPLCTLIWVLICYWNVTISFGVACGAKKLWVFYSKDDLSTLCLLLGCPQGQTVEAFSSKTVENRWNRCENRGKRLWKPLILNTKIYRVYMAISRSAFASQASPVAAIRGCYD